MQRAPGWRGAGRRPGRGDDAQSREPAGATRADRSGRRRLPRRARSLRPGRAARLEPMDRAAADAARRHHRPAQPAAQPQLRRTAHQGRGLRHDAPGFRRATERRHAPPGPAAAAAPGTRARHPLHRQLGRAALQARLARGHRRRAARRRRSPLPCCRCRLARHAAGRWRAARSVLRLGHRRHRGGADRLRHRPGIEAPFRLRTTAAVSQCRAPGPSCSA